MILLCIFLYLRTYLRVCHVFDLDLFDITKDQTDSTIVGKL